MEVTRSSFSKIYPIVEGAIKQAHFIAIDGEYSGLQIARNKAASFLDDIQQRYLKVKDSAQNFSILQFGLTTFTWIPEESKYNVKPFSFYLFSDPTKCLGLDRRCTFQASSVSFLTQYHFDFNKVFYEGIPFLSLQEEKNFRKKKEENVVQSTESSPTLRPLTDEDQHFVNQTCDLIETWLENGASSELCLPACNSFRRLLLYHHVKKRFNDTLTLTKNPLKDNNIGLIVQKLTAQEKRLFEKESEGQAESELQNEIGFRKVIDLIVSSQVPIIAHNSLLDFTHLFGKFIDRLPENVNDFKRIFHSHFPSVFDTKLISSLEPLKSLIPENSLCDLFGRLSSDPFEKTPSIGFHFEPGFDSFSKEGATFHDAAYDSYCTGVCFVKMAHYLQTCQKESTGDSDGRANALEIMHTWMPSLLNKTYLMKSDYEFFSFTSVENLPDRSLVFFVEGVPSTWNNTDIEKVFRSVITHWIDDTSFFISFVEKNNVFEHIEKIASSSRLLPVNQPPLPISNTGLPLEEGQCNESGGSKTVLRILSYSDYVRQEQPQHSETRLSNSAQNMSKRRR